jgi:hypothetical protein
MDPLINDWTNVTEREGFADACSSRKFLDQWIDRMKPLYMAVSMPYDFMYPDNSPASMVLRDVVIPTAKAHDLPFALMIGVKRQINPLLGDAGDSVGRADCPASSISAARTRTIVPRDVLSREKPARAVYHRSQVRNMTPFGCWWFLNNPSIIAEITSERLEMLGTSMIPQHSDCRISSS